MKVSVADKAGACFGVDRALKLAVNTAEKPQPVHTWGPLIHNPRVVAELAAQGVAEASDLAEADSGTIIIRSHGTTPQAFEQAREQGFAIVDATCPFVAKVQQRAAELGREGFGVVIVGDAGHAEVEGIRAWGGDAIVAVVTDPAELPAELPSKLGVVVQTTQSPERFDAIVEALEERGIEVQAFKTICNATQQRQRAARELAQQVDTMVVIGGRNSGNTRRLVEICSAICPTHHIESEDELDPAWFDGLASVGITAGASTPQAHIDAVAAALKEL